MFNIINYYHYYCYYLLFIICEDWELIKKKSVKLSFLDVTKFRETEVDIMTGDARKLIEILNFKNKDDVLKMCQHYANVDTDEAFIFHIDRFGFNVAAKKTVFISLNF